MRATTPNQNAFAAQREEMVQLIRSRGVRDRAVCEALREVRRDAFVPEEVRGHAYDDSPLPIGNDQTISQPYIVALMAAELGLSPGDRVLEIGAGSGYAAAILARVATEVFTVERHAELAERAEGRLREQGFSNVRVHRGDGTLGWPEHAPYDAITVAAGGPEVPKPLLEQLAVGGRLVMPVGEDRREQRLVRVTKVGPHEFHHEDLGGVHFVPLVGEAGWD